MTYKELFSNYPIIKKISLIQLVAYFGAWFSNVAIYTMLIDFGTAPLIISIVAAMHFLPGVLLAPFSGALLDRLPLKRLMITLLCTELIMTLMFLTIRSGDDVWLLMLFLFIRMGAASMFFNAEMTLMPKLISGDALQKANEIHSIIWSFTFTAGMAAGGVVVNTLGVYNAFLIDSAFFITALLFFTPLRLDIKTKANGDKIFKMIKDGFIYIKEHPLAFKLILLHASVGLTAFDTLVALLADFEYKEVIAVPLAIGLSNAIRAFALMIGPLFITNWVNKQRLTYLFIFQGLAIIVWAFTQFDFYFALLSLFLTGFTTTTLWSYTYALLQNNIEDEFLGRSLAYNEMFFMLSTVTTTIFIGVMANYVSLVTITVILGIGFLVTAYYYKRVDELMS